MTTANLSLGLKTDSALAELMLFKGRMQQEMRGIAVTLDQSSLSSALKSAAEGQALKVNFDASALRSELTSTLREAFAARHRVQIDQAALTHDVKSAISAAGGVGVSTSGTAPLGPISASGVDQLKATINAVLVPAVDNMSRAAIAIGGAAKAAGVRTSQGGSFKASESTSFVDPGTGRRRTVTETLGDPKAVLKQIDQLKELQAVSKGLDNAFSEIQALRTKSASNIDARTLLGLPSEESLKSAKASAAAFKEVADVRKALDNSFSEIQALRTKSASNIDARTLLGLPSDESMKSARSSAEAFKEVITVRKALDNALGEIQALRTKSASNIDARTLLGLPSADSVKSARASAAAFQDEIKAAQAEMDAFFKASKFQASSKYNSRGSAISAAQSLSDKFGSQAAADYLGSQSHLLSSTGELEKNLKKVTGASKEAAEGHKAVRAAMEDAHSAARGLAGSVGMLWTTWGNTAAIVAAASIGASLRATVMAGKELEYQLRFVSVLSDGATVSMDQFGTAIRSSLTTPREAAEAMRALAQNGLSVRESLAALPTVLNLATAGEMSLSEAALGATGVMTAFGLSVGDIGRVSDVFAKAAAISNTSVQGMVEAMRQASTVSDLYHVSLEQTAAALTSMAQRNIEGTAAGTAFRNMWVELATPTKKAQDAMKALGLQVYDSSKQLMDADVVLGRMHDKLATLDEQSRLNVLNDMFGERGAKAANAILSDMDAYSKNLERIKNESKDFTKSVVDALNDTVQGKLKALYAEFEMTAAKAFDGSSVSVKNFLDNLRAVAGSQEFAAALKSIMESVTNLTNYIVQHGEVIVATLAVWKGTQWYMAARASFIGLRAELAATNTALEATAITARATHAAITGGISIVAALALEYFFLRDKTDQATASQVAYNNSLSSETQRLRDAEKAAHDRTALLELTIKYQREGLSLTDARAKAESETSVKSVRNLEEEIARTKALRDEHKRRLSELEANPGYGRDGLPSSKKLQETERLKAMVAAEEKGISELYNARNQAALTADESLRESQSTFDSKRLEEIRQFNARVADALAQNPQLKLGQLTINAGDAPTSKEEFDSFMKKRNAAFNSNAVHLPPRGKNGHEADRLLRAQEAYDKSLAALNKANSDVAVQQERDTVSRLQEINQYQYETGLVTYSKYLGDKQALTERDRKFQEAEARRLYQGQQALADKAFLDSRLAPATTPEGRVGQLTAANEATRTALEAKAKLDKVIADNSAAALKEQAAVYSSIHDSVQKAKDDQLDSLLPGSTKQSRLATEAEQMRARIAIYKEGSEERIALEKQVAEYVDITQQKIMNDSLQSWVESLNGSLRTAADGFAGMVKGVEALMAVERNRQEQADHFDKLKKESQGNESALLEIAARERVSIKQTEQQQIEAYATMASSAKKMFAQHTAGYKALQAAEQGLRTYQLVMSAKVMTEELVGIAGRIAAWVTGESVMTAASVVGSGERTAAAVVEGQASAVAAVANQGKGDPYSAFPRIAAMAAIMAALGFAVLGRSGSSGQTDSKALQEAQGTGTVFGDPTAKSESIKKALEHLSSVAAPQLAYTSQMAASLRNIESQFAGLAGQILRNGTSLTGAGFKASTTPNDSIFGISKDLLSGLFPATSWLSQVNPILGKISNAVFGSTKVSLQDSGIQFGAGSLASALSNGLNAWGYQSVEEKSSSLFGLMKSSKSYDTYQNLDPTVQNQLNTVIRSMYSQVLLAGQALGESTDSLASKLSTFSVDLGRISLMGLDGAKIQEQLTAVFGALGDKLAMAANSGYTDFQKVGEGYLETLTRLATGMEQAKFYTEKLGLATVTLSSVTNKQGDVAAEVVRQSILAKEATNGIGQIISSFDGNASQIYDTYKALSDARMALVGLGNSSVQVSSQLIAGAGDMNALASGLSDYQDKFFTTGESIAIKTAKLQVQFDQLGVTMPKTNDQFRQLLNGIDGSTASGQKLYGSLLTLASAFADLTDTTKQFDNSRLEMQIALLKAQGNSEGALALQRQAQLDQTDPLLKALQQQVWMAQDLADSLTKLKDAGKSLSSFIDSLTAKMSPTASLASTRAAYLNNLKLARADDPTALSNTVSVAQAYINAAKANAKTAVEYAAVVGQVKAELTALHATQAYLQNLVPVASATASAAAGGSTTSATAFDAYVQTLTQRQAAQDASVTAGQNDTSGQLEALRVELKAANTAMATYLAKVAKIMTRWDSEQEADTGTF